jgi:hypothetical protein
MSVSKYWFSTVHTNGYLYILNITNSVITYIITYTTGTTSGAVTTYPSGVQPRILVGFLLLDL